MTGRASILVILLVLSGCGGGNTSSKQWDDIDYSRVHTKAPENDPAYTAPSVVGCVDDDLYNCNN